MNKFSYKLMLIVSTFILGLSAFNLWQFNTTEAVSVTSTDFKSLQKIDDKENLSMLKMSELKVNGIELGSSDSEVIKQFGKPLQNKKGEYDDCASGFRKTLDYDGMTVEFVSDEKGKDFTVASMEVTSSKRTVSGISVGADMKDVQARFKDYYSHTKESEAGLDTLSYPNGDGWINFDFQNGKLIRISWKYNFC